MICSKCKKEKSINDFHKNKKGKFGLKSHCKSCCSTIAKNEPKQLRQVATRNYRKNNKQKVNTINKLWRCLNPNKINSANKKWRDANLGVVSRLSKSRKKQIKQATIGKFDKELNLIYQNAIELEKLDNLPRHVHHVIPLQQYNNIVSGLHVPWNLEILTEKEHYVEHRKLEEIYKANGFTEGFK